MKKIILFLLMMPVYAFPQNSAKLDSVLMRYEAKFISLEAEINELRGMILSIYTPNDTTPVDQDHGNTIIYEDTLIFQHKLYLKQNGVYEFQNWYKVMITDNFTIKSDPKPVFSSAVPRTEMADGTVFISTTKPYGVWLRLKNLNRIEVTHGGKHVWPVFTISPFSDAWYVKPDSTVTQGPDPGQPENVIVEPDTGQTEVNRAVIVSWQPNDPAENIYCYRVYYGDQSQSYGSHKDAGNVTELRIEGLGSGTCYFAVTALNGAGESRFSEEVRYLNE